jgi:TonB family protein
LLHFDFDDRYPAEELVASAIPAQVRVVYSLLVHIAVIALLLALPRLPFFGLTPEEQAQRMEELRRQQQRPRENPTFVFVQPRVDLEAPKPPERGPASDRDRIARSPDRAPAPTNTLPFARGNSRERVEAAPMERARGPESPEPPSPGEAARTQPQGPQPQQRLPESATGGVVLPQETQPQARASSGALGEALRNLQRYVDRESFDNRGGDTGQFGPFIQFDTKGVEFGPWVRRFVAQVKRNWFIPYAAMTMRGHVVLQFNVHKDGRITDIAVVGPSNVDAFNNAAANAILTSNPTEPLPPEYPADKAFFTVTFYYNEEPPGR